MSSLEQTRLHSRRFETFLTSEASPAQGAQILVLVNMENSPILEKAL